MSRALAVSLCWLLLLTSCRATPTVARPPSPLQPTASPLPNPQEETLPVGTAAPSFVLDSLEGVPIALEDSTGQGRMLVFFSPYCGACQVELPLIETLYQQYQEQGLVVLAITAVVEPEVLSDMVGELGLTLPILIDAEAETGRAYRISAIPAVYFLDGEGIIRDVQVGIPYEGALEVLESRVQPILP